MFGKGTLGLFAMVLVSSALYPCTLVMAGKDATADGSVLSGHNNDLPGKIASMINIVPGKTHRPGETIRFKNGLEIPQARETFRMLVMQCYYGFEEGDAVAINQFGVSIAGGESLKDDRNIKARKTDPLIPKGVSGHIRYIALQRARTARECVQIIGAMYSKYGVSYPSAVGVADTKEAWYIEAGGGRFWAAVRVPDDSYLAAANGFRIGIINFEDRKNTIIPLNMKKQLYEKGLLPPGQKEFHFAKTFGGGSNILKPYYNSRRVWRIQQLLTPSVKQNPDSRTSPLFLKPDTPISISSLSKILRDHYQNTQWDSTTNSTERPIGYLNTVHTDIIQLRSKLPVEVGAVLWAGVGSSLTTPYIPYYFGIEEIPLPYRTASENPDRASAYWIFRFLTDLLEKDFCDYKKQIQTQWQKLERTVLRTQPTVEQCALFLHRRSPQKAVDYLTIYSGGLALQALQAAKELLE